MRPIIIKHRNIEHIIAPNRLERARLQIHDSDGSAIVSIWLIDREHYLMLEYDDIPEARQVISEIYYSIQENADD